MYDKIKIDSKSDKKEKFWDIYLLIKFFKLSKCERFLHKKSAKVNLDSFFKDKSHLKENFKKEKIAKSWVAQNINIKQKGRVIKNLMLYQYLTLLLILLYQYLSI